MESFVHGDGGGDGDGNGGGGGTVQLRRPISFAVQWSAITEQFFTSWPPGNMQSSVLLLLHVPDSNHKNLIFLFAWNHGLSNVAT